MMRGEVSALGLERVQIGRGGWGYGVRAQTVPDHDNHQAGLMAAALGKAGREQWR